MWASPLRELARRYAKGEIQKPEYQSERRRIIEDVLSGKSRLSYRDTLLKIPDAVARGGRTFPVKLAAIAGLGLLLVVGLVYVLLPSSDDGSAPAQPIATPADEAPAVDRAGIELLAGLMDAQSWDDAYLTSVEQRWMDLEAPARQAARADFRMRQVLGRIDDEIRAQEALLDLGNGNAQARIDRLRQLEAILKQG